jgi:hypothetical protein
MGRKHELLADGFRGASVDTTIALGMSLGRLFPVPADVLEPLIDHYNRTGEFIAPPDPEYGELEDRALAEMMAALPERFRPYLRALGDASILYLFVMDWMDSESAREPEKTYTIEQLRGAWGAGYRDGRRGRHG